MQERGKQQGRPQDDREREQAGQGRRGNEGGQGRENDPKRPASGRDVNRPSPMDRREENPQGSPRMDEQNREMDEDEVNPGDTGKTRQHDRDTQYWPKGKESERKERDPFATD